MFCDACGRQLPEGSSFCPSCGKAFQTAALVPPRGRIAGHARLLGILWLAVSALRLIPGVAMVGMFGRGADFLPGMPDFVHGMIAAMGWLFLGSAVAGLLAGWGLLQREPWARMLALVMGVGSLLEIPFGTALGIYTLWVLLPARSEQEYREVSRAT